MCTYTDVYISVLVVAVNDANSHCFLLPFWGCSVTSLRSHLKLSLPVFQLLTSYFSILDHYSHNGRLIFTCVCPRILCMWGLKYIRQNCSNNSAATSSHSACTQSQRIILGPLRQSFHANLSLKLIGLLQCMQRIVNSSSQNRKPGSPSEGSWNPLKQHNWFKYAV